MTNFFDSGYLLDPSPETFAYQDATIIFLIVAVVTLFVLHRLLKKKRDRIKLTVEQRLAFRKATWYALIGSIMLLLLVVFRTQGIAYLSMRLVSLLVGLGVVVSIGFGLLKVVMLKPKKDESAVVKESNFMDYLPKKKKK